MIRIAKNYCKIKLQIIFDLHNDAMGSLVWVISYSKLSL